MVKVVPRLLDGNRWPAKSKHSCGDLFDHLFLVNWSTEAQCDSANAIQPPCSLVHHTMNWGTYLSNFWLSAQWCMSGKHCAGRGRDGAGGMLPVCSNLQTGNFLIQNFYAYFSINSHAWILVSSWKNFSLNRLNESVCSSSLIAVPQFNYK